MATEEALKLLRTGKHGTLCTVSADGVPYGVPVNYYYDEEDQAIVFHCAVKGRKLDNIRANSRVCFIVVGEERIMEERYTTHYESVMVEGNAEIVDEPAEMERLLRRLCDALCPSETKRREEVIHKFLPAVRMVKVHIQSVSGKRNRDE
ncbi:MAG: pyridoxamine 5'-phosphate oxidase family protein [Clostridiales bacterium]|nr:pyridoxamine 5'-phosphate oxidase family protein [Clostridiales bacterium]